VSADELTADERRAIASLERLARRWPKSLKLFIVQSITDINRGIYDGFEKIWRG
jgi:hypothetical protein